MELLNFILLVVIVVLLIVILWKLSLVFQQMDKSDNENVALLEEKIIKENQEIKDVIISQQKSQQESALNLSTSLESSVRKLEVELLKNSNEGQMQLRDTITKSLLDIQNTNDRKLQDIQNTNDKKLQDIQNANDKRLQDIQNNVNEKLDKSLNERLDSSFKQIGDQLSTLYKSLGELQSLSSGVTDLQKTLSNVKTRGVFGEIQLKNILMDVLESSQYVENIATKNKSNDRVEFAIKIPDKEDKNGFIYLPIDSKFPADIYNKIIDAANNGEADVLKQAVKELEQRIKQEARTIRDKYIDPPNTTDFAIMFLPTEGLYAEVIRIANLTEWCQNECKIVISGPTTLVALLNSLSIGFRYLTVNKNSKEILKILSAVKAQYDKFGQLIQKTQKKLHEAQSATDDLQNRSEIIQKRLSKVEALDEEKAAGILGMVDYDKEEDGDIVNGVEDE